MGSGLFVSECRGDKKYWFVRDILSTCSFVKLYLLINFFYNLVRWGLPYLDTLCHVKDMECENQGKPDSMWHDKLKSRLGYTLNKFDIILRSG